MSANQTLLATLAVFCAIIGIAYFVRDRVPVYNRVNEWIFGYGSPVTMGVFRIFTGTLIFINFAMVGVDFDAWFTERGYVPLRILDIWSGTSPRMNLLTGVESTWVTLVFYGLVMLFAALTAVGLWTRVSSILLMFGVISLHHRNPIILHGGDTVLRAAAVIVAVAPSGASCSIDRLIRLWKNKEIALPQVSLWPQRLLQYQVAIIYFTTVWHKWFGATWRNGTATWYPPHLTEFDRFPFPDFLNHQPFLAITTYGTLLVELSLATLVFSKPLRKWVLLAGILLHATIEYRFNIPLFGYLMCSLYIGFYDGAEITEWAKRVGQRLGSWAEKIRLPAGTALEGGPGVAIRATDAFGLVSYEPGSDADFSAGWRWKSWSRSPGAWILGVIPGLWSGSLRKALSRSGASAVIDSTAPEVTRVRTKK